MDDGVIHIKDKPASGPVIRLHENDNVLIARGDIGIGTKLEIKQRHAFDGSVEIKIRNQALINLSEQLAKNIFVKPI